MSDAVEEFKVTTTMFDASLGRSNAGAMSVTTRSGNNQLGGSAYYYARDPSLNANSWQNNKAGIPRPSSSSYNLMGATLAADPEGQDLLLRRRGTDLTGVRLHAPGAGPHGGRAQRRLLPDLDRSGKPLNIYYPARAPPGRSPGQHHPANLIDPTGRASWRSTRRRTSPRGRARPATG